MQSISEAFLELKDIVSGERVQDTVHIIIGQYGERHPEYWLNFVQMDLDCSGRGVLNKRGLVSFAYGRNFASFPNAVLLVTPHFERQLVLRVRTAVLKKDSRHYSILVLFRESNEYIYLVVT